MHLLWEMLNVTSEKILNYITMGYENQFLIDALHQGPTLVNRT